MDSKILRCAAGVIVAFLLCAGTTCAQTTTPAISSLVLGDGSAMTAPQGPIGMGFIIHGTNLGATQNGGTVRLNGALINVLSWNSSGITVQLPAGATSGNVVVTGSGHASNGVHFTVTPPFGCS